MTPRRGSTLYLQVLAGVVAGVLFVFHGIRSYFDAIDDMQRVPVATGGVVLIDDPGDVPHRIETAVVLEIIRCERCGTSMECKANSYGKCACCNVQLTLNETQYVSELYDYCVCPKCLYELKEEYQNSLKN